MIFTYSCWERFCEQLNENGVRSIPAKLLMHEKSDTPYLVLKHDVETNVKSAFQIAKIEYEHGHCASYYVQAYLLKNPKNVSMLRRMQQMGHEISYHHDVMDANAGDLSAAMEEFRCNCKLFQDNGFHIETVCQHGNPVIVRKGYTSNRDFFRSKVVQEKFGNVVDIMVNFKEKAFEPTDYLYFSDAGRKFKLIFDPINNDILPSDDKNIPFDTLTELWSYVQEKNGNCIISTHPHRWVRSKVIYVIKSGVFKVIRAIAKILMKIPFLKKIMGKYYYLAKKL